TSSPTTTRASPARHAIPRPPSSPSHAPSSSRPSVTRKSGWWRATTRSPLRGCSCRSTNSAVVAAFHSFVLSASCRPPPAFVMQSTDARHLHHSALTRQHSTRLWCVFDSDTCPRPVLVVDVLRQDLSKMPYPSKSSIRRMTDHHVWKIVSALGVQQGTERVHPHAFRHACAAE